MHSDCVPFGWVTKLFSQVPSPSLNDAHQRPGFSRLESTRVARRAQPGGSAGGDGGGLGGAGGGGGGGAGGYGGGGRAQRKSGPPRQAPCASLPASFDDAPAHTQRR